MLTRLVAKNSGTRDYSRIDIKNDFLTSCHCHEGYCITGLTMSDTLLHTGHVKLWRYSSDTGSVAGVGFQSSHSEGVGVGWISNDGIE